MNRRAIDIEGFSHGDLPVPAASRIGNLIVTGGIFGLDTEVGRIPDDERAQCTHMFKNLRAILAAGDASMDDIVRLTFYVRSTITKDIVNEFWVGAFPDPETRPARHIIVNDHLIGNTLMLCEAIAYIR